jgi:Do/DeqQ family serine protease
MIGRCVAAGSAGLVMLIVAVAPAATVDRGPMLDPKRGVLTYAPLLEQVTGAVVNIATRSRVRLPGNPLFDDPFFRRFFDLPNRPRERQVLSAGSGVIVDAGEGYVLTNHHVVEHADEILVTLKDGREFEAELIGSDPETDVALLRIAADELMELPFGDSDALQVGDVVIAIGNPFGIGQTVTSGIVSALGRRGLGIEGYEDFIQTDASINPGNSGGALINSKGELIGINTAIIGPAGGNVGIGFAVPSNVARAVMDQLIDHGEVRRGRIGVAIQDLTPGIAEALGLERTQGAVVSQVEPGSPAAQAGLQPGDVIVAINDSKVEDSTDLRNQVALLEIGSRVKLEFLRDGRERRANATVAGLARTSATGEDTAPQLAGAVFQDLGRDSPAYGRVQGVLVAEVAEGSPAFHYGLREGDIVTHVGQEPVENVAPLVRLLEDAPPAIVLQLVRGGARMVIVIQ